MRYLRWFLLLLLLLGLTAGVAQAQDAACIPLEWNVPPNATDGTPLDPTTITAYRIYQQPPPLPDGTQPGWTALAMVDVADLDDPAAPTWERPTCVPQTCWMATAVLVNGRESFVSNVYCEPVPDGPRAGPPWGFGRGN